MSEDLAKELLNACTKLNLLLESLLAFVESEKKPQDEGGTDSNEPMTYPVEPDSKPELESDASQGGHPDHITVNP